MTLTYGHTTGQTHPERAGLRGYHQVEEKAKWKRTTGHPDTCLDRSLTPSSSITADEVQKFLKAQANKEALLTAYLDFK